MKAKKHQEAWLRMGKMVQNVNSLINLRVLQVSEDEPNIYIMEELWYGKNKAYKLQFCKNLLTYWHLNNQTPLNQVKMFTLTVFNKETAEFIATYHMEKGLILRYIG